MTRNRKQKNEQKPLPIEPVASEQPLIAMPATAPTATPQDTKAVIGIALLIQADKTIPVPFIRGDINIAEALALLKQLENYIMTRKMVIKDDQQS